MRALIESRGTHRILVGVVHLLPLPGAPRWAGSIDAVLDHATDDARVFFAGGFDAVIVENFGDVPFFAGAVPPETLAAMTRAVEAVHAVAGERPVGVNVLRNDARAAVGLCASTSASFFRVNVHTGAMVTDQGLIEGEAAATLRERARLSPDAFLFADVQVKHARPLGEERLEDAARETCGRGLADALVITGTRTGAPPSSGELAAVREAIGAVPLFVGSGLDEANAAEFLRSADGAIVGTACKRGGRVEAAVDPERVARLREAAG
jgi:uncharacterized protein